MSETKQSVSVGGVIVRILFTGLLAACLVFIFANSGQIGEISSGRSAQVTELLNSILARAGIARALSETTVRKLAHFAEFALMGFLMMLTLRVYTRRIIAFIAWPLFFGLLTAVMDELLQYFVPGRTSSVIDVLLDFSGVLGGMFAGLCILLVLGGFFRLLRL